MISCDNPIIKLHHRFLYKPNLFSKLRFVLCTDYAQSIEHKMCVCNSAGVYLKGQVQRKLIPHVIHGKIG